jgi:Tfp pilus assembly protein FimT
VELLVVVAVIGVSAGIAIPAMNNALTRNRVFTSTEIVAAQIRSARLAAITRNRPFRVSFSCAAGGVRILEVTGNPTVDNSADRCTTPQPNDGPAAYLPENVSLGVSLPPVLEINGRGQISAIGGTMPQNISVTYASFTRTLVVTSTGRVNTPSS